jgi:hypothetical protein
LTVPRLKYPPCTPGPFSERPRRHNFEVKLGADGRPILRVRDGVTYYHVVCTRCQLNDPARVLH